VPSPRVAGWRAQIAPCPVPPGTPRGGSRRAGAALGLAPSAWREAAGNSNFALKFGLPLAIGAALALALAPAYVAAAGRFARGGPRGWGLTWHCRR
jgi:hypothetical protein